MYSAFTIQTQSHYTYTVSLIVSFFQNMKIMKGFISVKLFVPCYKNSKYILGQNQGPRNRGGRGGPGAAPHRFWEMQ